LHWRENAVRVVLSEWAHIQTTTGATKMNKQAIARFIALSAEYLGLRVPRQLVR